MQFTGDAALLFAAQGEQLARETAEIVFDAGLFGDVMIEADDSDDVGRRRRCRECRECERRECYPSGMMHREICSRRVLVAMLWFKARLAASKSSK